VSSPLPTHGQHNPGGTRLVHLLLDLCGEADGGHDAVAKLLVHDCFVGIPIVLHNLVEAVYQGLDGRLVAPTEVSV
jgi:hypothetical protein